VNLGELRLHSGVIVFQLAMRPKLPTGRGSQWKCRGTRAVFRCSARVESGGARADAAHAQVAQAVGYAADCRKPRQVVLKSESQAHVCSLVSEYGIPYCRRLLQADIFPQKLSRRCRIVIFDASSAWPAPARERRGGRGGGVGDGALVAEVGQRDDYAIESLAIPAEQGGAALRFVVSLDRAVLAVFGAEHTQSMPALVSA